MKRDLIGKPDPNKHTHARAHTHTYICRERGGAAENKKVGIPLHTITNIERKEKKQIINAKKLLHVITHTFRKQSAEIEFSWLVGWFASW